MPEGLSKLAIGKWKSLVPELLALGVLTRVDGEALANLCTAYSHQRIAEKAIQRLGTAALDDEHGKLLKHWNDATKIMKQFEVEFGLTPASRSRLNVNDGEKTKDPADQYFANVRPIRSSQSA
jgi:P27 family predicted phage terminase small subunit